MLDLEQSFASVERIDEYSHQVTQESLDGVETPSGEDELDLRFPRALYSDLAPFFAHTRHRLPRQANGRLLVGLKFTSCACATARSYLWC